MQVAKSNALGNSYSPYFLKNHKSFTRVKKLRNEKMRLLHQFNEPAKIITNKSFKADKTPDSEETKLRSFQTVHDGVAYSIGWDGFEITSLEASYSSRDFLNPRREWLPINDPDCFKEAYLLLKKELLKNPELNRSEYIQAQLEALKEHFAAESAK